MVLVVWNFAEENYV